MSARTRRGLIALAPVVLLLVLLAAFTLMDPRIATPVNLRNIVLQAVPVALLALSAYVVLVTAGIDLSAGYAVGLAGVVMAGLLTGGSGLPAALLGGLAAAAAVGLVNGVLIGLAGLPPFVATLGTMTIVQGLTMFAAPQGLMVVDDPFLTWLGQGTIAGLPVPVLAVAAVSAAVWFLMRRTRFGLRTYAYGSDQAASRLTGVRTGPQMVAVYLLAGVLVFGSALLLVAQVPLVQPNMGGIPLLLDAIAAAVLGGTSIFGGRGSVGGVLVGVLIIGLVTNALQILGVDPSAIDLFKGLIIVAALVLDVGLRTLHTRAVKAAA
ncbi:monosaccharide ABC transporter membrane protein (CUT2 family) [Murinocardiopsis flavida]|uniref:Monosaccharide ABC transporter membrane protein (CUT2 family) n=1 Tax=Murinocardiopsis flavida TaxID=645275 RepID=A0A2P8CXI0_9ACTN|nr:ABC transporter permease [Murinocardiopsis flavida]PSK89693.1 monosaccharide ABC transporter membrane protein (CUT2 family) [Murinocardiopsis flavida]